MELYQHLGFEQNPFSTYSAEEESDFLDNIYINPKFFSSLKSDISNGRSRFIIGARGVGKTALLSQLQTALNTDNAFSIIIDSFGGIPITNNENEFIRRILEDLTKYYCFEIRKTPQKLRKLNKEQKEKLSFIISEFFITLSSSEYNTLVNKTNIHKYPNFFKRLYNYIFNKPLNFLLAGSMEVISDTIRKSLGLPEINKEEFYKNYIPELTLQTSSHPQITLNYKSYKAILSDFSNIIKLSGFKTTVIFFDKIDEYTILKNNISLVADFLVNILKDTTILMNDSYSLVFSLWDAIKPELTNKGVRFDKIKPIDITWTDNEIKEILEKRIRYFSKETRELNMLIHSPEKLDEIVNLSNHSPRYTLRLLSYIYDCQADINDSATTLNSDAIDTGERIYCLNFDYYALYPTKSSGKEDIITNINRLLKIGKPIIKTSDYINTYKVSTPTAISYIRITLNYNLIKELPETDNGAKQYKIIDPVILHLIKLEIPELRK